MTTNMGPMDILRVFLILTSLQPVVKQRWLEASLHALIARLDRKRRSEISDLMLLYPQPVRGLPTVEYLPGGRVAEGAGSGTVWQA